MTTQYSVLDLFSGAGGLTEGFVKNGFNITSHIEMNHFAAQTLTTRSYYHSLIESGNEEIYYQYYDKILDLNDFKEEYSQLDLQDPGVINCALSHQTEDLLISKVYHQLSKQNLKEIDVIIGGPPCQAYSLIGRGRDRNKMENDPRNHLYLHYLRFIKEFNPEIFVFENVPGLTSAKYGVVYSDFLQKIDDLGYYTEPKPKKLNAQDFGVLQNRKRIIIIGWKKEHKLTLPQFDIVHHKYRVKDLLSDLPPLEPGMGSDGPQAYRPGRPGNYLKEFDIRNGHKYVRNHVARNHIERDCEIYRIAIKLWNNDKKRLKYNELPESLKNHKNQSSFLDRFKVVDGEGASHSIVAHLSKDGHYFIHPDINQGRSLTPREAARIQSFPDDYLFEGPRTSQFVQIGNAVPPLMAGGIAKKIRMMLESL